MKRAQLLLAFSAIAGSTAILSADDCDSSKLTGCTNCKCAQNDDGLLDLVDSVVGRIHAGVRQGVNKFGSLPSRAKGANSKCGQQASGCDCQTCQSGDLSGQSGSTYYESYATPPSIPSPRTSAPSHGEVPPSLNVPAPVPDSQVNPFLDEPVHSGQSRVRSRTIQYRSNNNPGTSPRAPYGQKYNSQAKRTHSTADYWSQEAQPSQAQQVAPASSQTPTLEEVFRPAYRVNLRDTDEGAVSSSESQPQTSRTSSLRPVPKSNLELHSSTASESVESYERVIKPTPVYDNPLRR